MPWILRHKKELAILALFLVLELLYVTYCCSKSMFLIILLVDAMIFILLFVDTKFFYIICEQMKPFEPQSQIREVDFLVVGEPICTESILPKGKKYVQVIDPNVSESAVLQIIKRTHSILNSNGTVIVALKKENAGQNYYRIIDTFFMHRITVEELKIGMKSHLRKLVFFFNPVSCFRMLSNKRDAEYYEKYGGETAITDFCKERGYSVQFFVK